MFIVFALWYLGFAVGCFDCVVDVDIFGSWCADCCGLCFDCWFGFVINSVGRFHGYVYFNLCCGLLIWRVWWI